MSASRVGIDSFDPIEGAAQAMWGAQTARSLQFCALDGKRMPREVIHVNVC